MDITDWRIRIDALDEQIVKLLNERAACAIAIGDIKRQTSAAIYEPGREKMELFGPGFMECDAAGSKYRWLVSPTITDPT